MDCNLYYIYIYSSLICIVLTRECVNERRVIQFFKIRSCHRSKLPIIAWKNIHEIHDCMKYAREKNGLALNYAHPDLLLNRSSTTGNFKNCQILGCPEINSSQLIFDTAYDYYSAYGNFSENATCIKSAGLFTLIHEKRNYTEAIKYCQNMGADLANILSEIRTNTLSTLLQSLGNWYKAAYVGLDNLNNHRFQSPMGDNLYCTNFRAWGPGHPIPRNKSCVILDAEKVWRAINCKIKMASICEIFPNSPLSQHSEIKKMNCKKIKNLRRKKQCIENNELHNLIINSTRAEQCVLLNDDFS